jgi:hypothetical protein
MNKEQNDEQYASFPQDKLATTMPPKQAMKNQSWLQKFRGN